MSTAFLPSSSFRIVVLLQAGYFCNDYRGLPRRSTGLTKSQHFTFLSNQNRGFQNSSTERKTTRTFTSKQMLVGTPSPSFCSHSLLQLKFVSTYNFNKITSLREATRRNERCPRLYHGHCNPLTPLDSVIELTWNCEWKQRGKAQLNEIFGREHARHQTVEVLAEFSWNPEHFQENMWM